MKALISTQKRVLSISIVKFSTIAFSFIILFSSALHAQKSAPKKNIYMDIAHKQKFWNDPENMKGYEANQIERVKYMTGELMKNASSFNADLKYIKEEIKPTHLKNCDLLFIHIPSSKYGPEEVKTIQQYLENGGSLFLVMDADYWSTLDQTNVNDIISPFGLKFGGNSPDTLSGGYTKASEITDKRLKITYHGGRMVEGGTPFCFNNQTEEYPFGTFIKLKNGGKIVAMGDGMVSLYMTSWKEVNDYQCSEFMNQVFSYLLN